MMALGDSITAAFGLEGLSGGMNEVWEEEGIPGFLQKPLLLCKRHPPYDDDAIVEQKHLRCMHMRVEVDTLCSGGWRIVYGTLVIRIRRVGEIVIHIPSTVKPVLCI